MEKIAKEFAQYWQVPLLQVLRKTNHSQHTLSYTERCRAAPFIFLRQNLPIPKRILLLDDVCTSGTTLLQSARALQSGGAEKIYRAVFAKVESNQQYNANSNEKGRQLTPRRMSSAKESGQKFLGCHIEEHSRGSCSYHC